MNHQSSALLGHPYSLSSLYPATYATALAPKGYTLDGLTCIISTRTIVGVARFELTTSCSQSRRSTRLSYTPQVFKVLPAPPLDGIAVISR